MTLIYDNVFLQGGAAPAEAGGGDDGGRPHVEAVVRAGRGAHHDGRGPHRLGLRLRLPPAVSTRTQATGAIQGAEGLLSSLHPAGSKLKFAPPQSHRVAKC